MRTFPYSTIAVIVIYAHWPPSEQAHALFLAVAAAARGTRHGADYPPVSADAFADPGIVKIDPPVHSETDIRKINAIGLDYIHFCRTWRRVPSPLNHPAGLIHLVG